MNTQKRFSQLFKLSAGKVQVAFGLAKRIGSLDGVRLMAAPSTEATFVVAITRLVKGSVIRNKIRRRIKAIVHEGIKEFGPLPNNTWLCVIYPAAVRRSYQELKMLLHRSLWQSKKNG